MSISIARVLVFGVCLIHCGLIWAGGEQVWIPTTETRPDGTERHLKLEATLYKPDGNGPFPVVLFSHGSTGQGAIREKQTLRPDSLARTFIDQGFAVIAPMRRGRGTSEGMAEEPEYCGAVPAARGLDNALTDTDAAVAYVKTLPLADSTRMLLAGISRGGFLSIMYGARHPQSVVGVVNFVGGWLGDACRDDFNEQSLKCAGASLKVPTLWLYADNDTYYSPHAIRSFVSTYTAAGGNATFRLYGPVEKDGHMLPNYPDVWIADFRTFMARIGSSEMKRK